MKMPTGWTGPNTVVAAFILAGFMATVALSWPGHLSYDSVLQLHQGRIALYNNWHPPVMAWLLGLGDALLPGAGLFVVFDCLLAFGALLSLLALNPGRATGVTAAFVLCVVLSPQLAIYQGLVWKDVLFADGAVAGFVALAHAAHGWSVASRRNLWLTASGLLLLLSALTRQNGVILLPIAGGALCWIAAVNGTGWGKAALMAVGFLAVLFVAGESATALFNLRSDGNPGTDEQIRLLQVYDIAGAVARQPDLALDQLHDDDPRLETLIRGKGVKLYTPVRNDPLASDPQIAAALADADPEEVGVQWRALVLDHPLLYLRVRAAAFGWVFATPDIGACRPVFTGIEGPDKELKELGIRPRRDAVDRMLESYGKAFFGTPVFSHLAFAAVAASCLVLLLRRRRPADIAIAAMLAATFAFTASFFAISIACDYRYLYALDLSALTALVYLALDARGIFKRTA